jgi:hypothetical protein
MCTYSFGELFLGTFIKLPLPLVLVLLHTLIEVISLYGVYVVMIVQSHPTESRDEHELLVVQVDILVDAEALLEVSFLILVLKRDYEGAIFVQYLDLSSSESSLAH